ncbi:hypothetical protein QQS21_004258 [Conoideocrella luteorostrata]|uniref:Glucose-methanol-choline oxidoreductase N-terminal domain-containing protein n=1 Tax=Conoideocrella luteorostrata TaxID=1105319 RepID=A0AAJ0CRX4_9HYPO|nr:hypothetical protein QQS21_004258 [Conoideocrella luteorostrata]
MLKTILKNCFTATVLASYLVSAHPKILLGSSFGVPGDNVTYDYVIIGGGTAGLTIATRLVEQKVGSVAVIEAGSFYEISNGNYSELPALGNTFAGKGKNDWQPLIDWGYQTTPQLGALNQSLHYARGKTFGGCSARNYMVYHRPPKGAHKRWADMVGDDAYSWDKFFPWYKKSVNFTAPNMNLRMANSTPEYVAADAADGQGHLSVTWPNYGQAFGTWATEAFKQVGLSVVQGFLSGKLLGQSWVSFTINPQTMHRESSETAFLRSSLGNPDYKLHPRTMVKKIIFKGKRATGVLVDTEGFQYVLSARKEVILSAGTFGSPQILMVSGVGPARHLQSLNIPVVRDSPGVGKNMQDHVLYGVGYRVNAPTISSLQNPTYAAEQARLYQEQAAGMYTSPATDVLAWEKIPASLKQSWTNRSRDALATMPADWPEVEYIAIPALLGAQVNSRHTDPNDGFNYATLAIAVVAPQSRGTLSIASADTYDQPIINPGFLTNRADVDVAVAAVKRIRQVAATGVMQKNIIGDEYFPGKNVSTDAEIEHFVRSSFNTMWHAAGTCAMGRIGDPKAVVDSKGRVIGTEGLRVADASAFPFLVPGHLVSTVCKSTTALSHDMFDKILTSSLDALAEKIACDIAGNCNM